MGTDGFNVINLSSCSLSVAEKEVLSLGMDFCPDIGLDKFKTITDIHLFVRKLSLKTIFHKQEKPKKGLEVPHSLSKSKCRALKELLESDPIPDTQGISTPPEIDLIDTLDLDTCLRLDSPLKPNLSSLKKKSTTFPPPTTNANANQSIPN